MKKAYTITPEEYKFKAEQIRNIEYKYGDKAAYAPETTKKRYDKLVKECAEFPTPANRSANRIFMTNTDLYNLWLNQHTDEPITAKELFNIIKGITEVMSDKISTASYQWDGSSTIM